ncbi:unnamed protein product [Symbiodinium sp. CCMP2456]|nr:unnamed protein product [Symbiodinium sp. CCMP2456]
MSNQNGDSGASSSEAEETAVMDEFSAWTTRTDGQLKGKLDIITAGGEDYERFIFLSHARRLGVEGAFEVSNRRDFRMALRNSQAYNQGQPFVVFLGEDAWLEDINRMDLHERPPYVVNMNLNTTSPAEFDAHVVSSCLQDEVAALLCQAIEIHRQKDPKPGQCTVAP